MPTSVSIVGETSVSVSVSGSTGASVSVSASGTGVSVSSNGGIGPAGFLTPAGTSANLYGVLQLAAGSGITISTTSGQFTIASYDTAAAAGFAPVQSVAGRTGTVVLQAADVTAGTFNIARIPTISYTALSDVPATFSPSSHTHSTTDVASFTAAASAAAPVQSVQGQTGIVSLSRVDITAAAAVHTHSTSDIVGLTAGFAQGSHTHDAADVTSGTFAVDRIPTIGYTALSGVPTAFTPATHTHDASAIAAGTISVARLPTHVASINGLTGTITIAAGSNVTVSTSASTITIAAGGGATGNVSWVSVPSTPTSSGTAGQFAQNSSYMFACYSANMWLRVLRNAWILSPGAPAIVSTASDSNYITFAWNPPAYDGGELTNYVVQRDAQSPVTVASNVTSHTFTGLTTSTVECNIFTVSVKSENSVGQSTAASTNIAIPNVDEPIIHAISKTPNEGAPGVQYTVNWHGPCVAEYAYNQFEVQTRLFFNGSENVSQGAEENWEAFATTSSYSSSQQISTATSSQQWEFRVRAKYVVSGSVVATTGWSSPSAY